MDGNSRRKYIKLWELIGYSNLEDVKKFVADEDITAEDYYSLWETASDEDWEFKSSYPLCAAALKNSSDILQFLIYLGFDPDGAHLDQGERPIHSACISGHPRSEEEERDEEQVIEEEEKNSRDNFEVVRILVMDHEVDINVIYGDYTPVLLAAQEGTVQVVRLLVEAGADLDATTSVKGYTALHLAAMSGSAELCKYLLSRDMCEDESECNGRSPLHYAAFFNNVKAAEVLLDADADVNRRDEWGCSRLGSAFYNNDLNLLRFLCSRGADPEPDFEYFLREAVHWQQYDIARFLLVETRISLSTRYTYVDTPFARAMKKGNIKLAKLLVDCGLDIHKEPCIFDADLRSRYASFINSLTDTPRNLQDICCLKIRSLMDRHVMESVNALSIPNVIKNILLLNQV